MKNERLTIPSHKHQKGFTLLELMIVVAIVAVLAAISTTGYRIWVKKSRKSEARTNLSTLAVLVEEYNSLYGRYCPDCTDTSNHIYTYKENNNGAVTTDTITNWLDFKPKQASSSSFVRYDYTITANANTSFTVKATPVVGRGVLNDILTLDQNGAKNDGTSNSW
jgi:prepilin-type N-terminal cleavage/methylation domain-containing protein